jgi:hypothetical protein
MFKRKPKKNADVGNFVKAKTKHGEVRGVLISFRGKKMVETRSGIEDFQEITDVTPTQKLGAETQHFMKAVRRRRDLQ